MNLSGKRLGHVDMCPLSSCLPCKHPAPLLGYHNNGRKPCPSFGVCCISVRSPICWP